MTWEDVPLPASRARLAAVLRATKEVVSIDAAAKTLDLDRSAAAKVLSRWLKQGWLRRIGQGLYVPVPLDLAGSEQLLEDPWVLVPTLFGESYIGGWTAAHHWDLTEQLFNETVVFTTRRIGAKRVIAQGVAFLLHHTTQKRSFGLKSIWRGSITILSSTSSRSAARTACSRSSRSAPNRSSACARITASTSPDRAGSMLPG